VKASNTYGTTKFSASDKGYRSDGTPLVPTNISASDGTYTDRVEVTWSASLRAESYKVYRARSTDPGATKTLLGTTSETFFNDTTTLSMKTYYYWVKASNTYGTTKFSASDKGYRSDGTPLVPTNISASDGTHTNRVEVTWSASLRAESYKVYRSRSSDPEATKVLLGTTTETFLHDTTAVAGRTYFYWVKASNTIGTTKFSAPDKGYR
jgi:fibronectin type 3 domain-containing protein